MNRRDFLRRSALVAAGIAAADQLEILEGLTWRRRFFAWGPLADCHITGNGGTAVLISANDTAHRV